MSFLVVTRDGKGDYIDSTICIDLHDAFKLMNQLEARDRQTDNSVWLYQSLGVW